MTANVSIAQLADALNLPPQSVSTFMQVAAPPNLKSNLVRYGRGRPKRVYALDDILHFVRITIPHRFTMDFVKNINRHAEANQ